MWSYILILGICWSHVRHILENLHLMAANSDLQREKKKVELENAEERLEICKQSTAFMREVLGSVKDMEDVDRRRWRMRLDGVECKEAELRKEIEKIREGLESKT